MNVVVFSRVAALYQAILKQCKGVQSVKFQYAAPEDPAAIRSHVQDADVLIADPNDISRLLDQHALPSAKWVHCSFAGVEKVVYHPTAKPTFILTRQAGYFGPQMAEYVLAQIINRERRFFQLHDNQKTSLWSSPQHHDMQYRLLSTLTIGILGAGDIGKKVAALCKSFGMTVWGLTRTPAQGREKCPDIDHYRQLEGLPELLAHSDYVCGVLPSTPQTVGLLDGDVLQHCSSKVRGQDTACNQPCVECVSTLHRSLFSSMLVGAIW